MPEPTDESDKLLRIEAIVKSIEVKGIPSAVKRLVESVEEKKMKPDSIVDSFLEVIDFEMEKQSKLTYELSKHDMLLIRDKLLSTVGVSFFEVLKGSTKLSLEEKVDFHLDAIVCLQ